MRILHLIATLSPSTGGPGEACLGLCRELAKRGHEVSIYTTAFGHSDTQGAGRTEYPLGEPVYDGGVEIRFFAETDRRFYLSSPSLYRALRTVIPTVDIVHIHSIYLFHSTVGAYLCRRFHVPYVIKPHGTLDPYLRRRHRLRKWLHEIIVERRSFRGAAAIQFTATEEMELATKTRIGRRLFESSHRCYRSQWRSNTRSVCARGVGSRQRRAGAAVSGASGQTNSAFFGSDQF